MSNIKNTLPELLKETPATVTPAEPGAQAEKLELIEDNADVVRMDLRKFNKTQQKIALAVRNVTSVTVINSLEGVDKMMLDLKELDGVAKVVEAKRKELGDPYRKEVDRINAHVKDLVKDVEPAIKTGKALILGFHKAEEKKVKDARTQARIAALKALQLTPRPRKVAEVELIDWVFINGAVITAGQVEDLPDDIYFKTIGDTVAAIEQAKLDTLRKEKEGAEFFGDEDAIAEVVEKMEQVSATPCPITSFGGYSSSAPAAKGLTKRWTYELTDLSLVPREYLLLDEKRVKEAVTAGTRSIPGIRIYQDESISLR